MPALPQDSFADVQKRISEITLKNGMKIIVLERHQAPVASFLTRADVGSAQDPKGFTGMAHMFEHMAFKGTPRIGTTNWAEEKLSLDRVEKAFFALRAERDKGTKADPAQVKQLQDEFKAAQDTASKFIVKEEFSEAIERAGGRGLNAGTSNDYTVYFYSLPSNSTELWFNLEAERFREPVMREFYQERDVVMEERRMRTDSNPIGKMIEEFVADAFKSHPYGVPTIGHQSDLENLTATEAMNFFRTYYRPSNMVSVIVGDVKPEEIKRLAEQYLEKIPSGPKPDPIRTVEPPQQVERRLLMRQNAQRMALMGYHKPAVTHPDAPIYDAIASILSEGRSSRLYTSLVRDKRLAVQSAGFDGFPGQKYPNLFLFYAMTAPGKTNEQVEEAMNAEVEKLKSELVSAEELQGVKTRARVQLLGSFKSNTGMAQALADWQVLTGDWRNLFRYLEKLEAVTPQDIQRVAKSTFMPNNRTVGVIEPLQQAQAAAPAAR